MPSFANQVVLITGAGSGIGRQLAIDLAAEGAAIAAIDLHAEALTALERDLPGKRLAWAVADVTDRPALIQAVQDLRSRLGPIDVLIGSAGVGIEMSAHEFRAADLEIQVRVNLIGVANSIEAVLPDMLVRKSGHLAAISSLASIRGIPKLAGYSASKAGLNAMLDSLRVELKGEGIAVSTICPSFIRTPMTKVLEGSQVAMMSVEDASLRIIHALRRRQTFSTIPRKAALLGHLLRMVPLAMSDWIVSRMWRNHKEDKDRKSDSVQKN